MRPATHYDEVAFGWKWDSWREWPYRKFLIRRVLMLADGTHRYEDTGEVIRHEHYAPVDGPVISSDEFVKVRLFSKLTWPFHATFFRRRHKGFTLDTNGDWTWDDA